LVKALVRKNFAVVGLFSEAEADSLQEKNTMGKNAFQKFAIKVTVVAAGLS